MDSVVNIPFISVMCTRENDECLSAWDHRVSVRQSRQGHITLPLYHYKIYGSGNNKSYGLGKVRQLHNTINLLFQRPVICITQEKRRVEARQRCSS